MPCFDLLEIRQLSAMGSLTEPGAVLLRPLMPPADASIRFNRSILTLSSQKAFLILPW